MRLRPDNPALAEAIFKMLTCLIVRNGGGALCGYVGVGMTHPAFGKGYNDVDVMVHGGLTFAGECQKTEDEGRGVCHVHPGGGKVWWLGFDCSHYGDVTPKYDALAKMIAGDRSTYKDVDYVKNEVANLAIQVAAMEVVGARKAWTTFRNIVSWPVVWLWNSRGVQRLRHRHVVRSMTIALPKLTAAIEQLKKEKANG